MTRYFVMEIHVFDIGEYHTAKSLKKEIEATLDVFTSKYSDVCWETTKVKEVEIGEYEKDEQNEKI